MILKNKYAKAAVNATIYYQRNPIDIVQSWNKAVLEQYPTQIASRNKTCPKNAYLGLCDEGYVKGVPAGEYLGNNPNKMYAIEAYKLIKSNVNYLSYGSTNLWRKLKSPNGVGHNKQMDVVLGLAQNNLLNI